MALQNRQIMKTTLDDIAELSMGHAFRGSISDREDGFIRVLQIRNIRNHSEVHYEHLPRIRWLQIKQDGRLQAGDVVMPARGDHYHAVSFRHQYKDNDLPVVATNQLFIIRPKSKSVSSDYLCWFLNQSQVQRQIMTYRTVSTIPMLDRRSLGRITVWLPPLESQRKIIALHQTWQQEKRLYIELTKNRERMMQGLFQQILRESTEIAQ